MGYVWPPPCVRVTRNTGGSEQKGGGAAHSLRGRQLLNEVLLAATLFHHKNQEGGSKCVKSLSQGLENYPCTQPVYPLQGTAPEPLPLSLCPRASAPEPLPLSLCPIKLPEPRH